MTDDKSNNKNAFEKIVESIVPNSDATELPDVPEVLYHYTNASGTSGILKNHSLWATDSRFLNDRTELTYAEDLAREIITERSAHPKNDISAAFLSNCLQGIGNYGSPMSSFLFCMSANPDSLSQWRGYAGDGRGFTIGFDGKRLHGAAGPGKGFGLQRVEYDTNIQTKTISLIVEQIESALIKSGDQSEVESAADSIIWAIFRLSYFYKHRSFREENEWRLACVMFTGDSDDYKDHVCIRSRNDELVPYVNLSPRHPDDLEKLMVSRIGIGPGFSHDNQRTAIKNLMHLHGYDAEIYQADTPFRRA